MRSLKVDLDQSYYIRWERGQTIRYPPPPPQQNDNDVLLEIQAAAKITQIYGKEIHQTWIYAVELEI